MTSIYQGRPDLVADARALDRALRPVVDRVLARLGLTRAQVLAQQPTPPPVAAAPVLTRAIIEARLAENPRTECADCGCEEYCIDYLRDCLGEIAAAPVATPVAARDARRGA